MIKIEKKYQGLIFLMFLVLVLSAVKIKYQYQGSEEKQETKIVLKATPTEIILKPTKTQIASDSAEHPLNSRLPYLTENFSVEKYSKPKTLLVKLIKSTEAVATKEINLWLKSFGEAGKGHKLEFEN